MWARVLLRHGYGRREVVVLLCVFYRFVRLLFPLERWAFQAAFLLRCPCKGVDRSRVFIVTHPHQVGIVTAHWVVFCRCVDGNSFHLVVCSWPQSFSRAVVSGRVFVDLFRPVGKRRLGSLVQVDFIGQGISILPQAVGLVYRLALFKECRFVCCVLRY